VIRYRRAWGPLRRSLRRAIDGAPSTTLLLHMPKTGGSSLALALRTSPFITAEFLPLNSVPRNACECGVTSWCVDHHRRAAIRARGDDPTSDRPLVVKFSHESYGAADWVRQTARRDGLSLPVVLPVRPRHARLRSAFTDYWTQIALATGQLTDRTPTPHVRRVLAMLKADSVHYRTAEGPIDGVGWFRSFARYGPGVVFSLDEAFDGDPARLQRELDSGALRLVPTSSMDAFITEFTGLVSSPRRRTSLLAKDPAVEAALADAADLIDELAVRDARFDRVIADHLGDPGFYVD